MNDAPETRATLLMRLRDPADNHAWSQFVGLYTPLIYQFLRRQGFQQADAADVAQEVLRSVADAMPGFQYDPAKGNFRAWLWTVTRSRAADWTRQNRKNPAAIGDSIVVDRAESQSLEKERQHWEADYRQRVFELACQEVEPAVSETTWKAFWATSVEGRAAEEVARELGMSVGAVYVARSRTTARLRDVAHKFAEAEPSC